MHMEPNSMTELQALVRDGFTDWSTLGNVRAVYGDGLVLFNYTSAAQYEDRWNWFEQVSRGLILDAATGEVVARPFDKFWNWGERGRASDGHIVTVTEKIDGSLGILYRAGGQYAIATRGSFNSEQAQVASQILAIDYDLDSLPDEYTLLFEIVYPGNRIVVDYGTTEDLFLLAVRNRHTGEYLPFYPDVYELAYQYRFPTPKVCDFNNTTDIMAATDTLDANAEGWVVEFSDGQRFKFKGDRYLELHRIVTGATFKRVLQEVANGTFGGMIATVPDELLDQIQGWKEEIDYTVDGIIQNVETAFLEAPRNSRKGFALWTQAEYPDLAPYLFRKLDGRDYRPLIYKLAFLDRQEESTGSSTSA
jgi:RNA ligase